MSGFVSPSRVMGKHNIERKKKGRLTDRKQSQDPSAQGPISQRTCCLYTVLGDRIVDRSSGLGRSWLGKLGWAVWRLVRRLGLEKLISQYVQ